MISKGTIRDRVAFETELLQFEAEGASSAFLRQARAQVNYLNSLDLPADLIPIQGYDIDAARCENSLMCAAIASSRINHFFGGAFWIEHEELADPLDPLDFNAVY